LQVNYEVTGRTGRNCLSRKAVFLSLNISRQRFWSQGLHHFE